MKPSIKDIALDTGLSTATISKYLREKKILPENRAKIEESIDRLGYIPNRNAQMLRSGKTHTIGLVVGDLSNTFWGSIVDYIAEYLLLRGYMTVIYSGEELEEGGRNLSNILAQNLDGLIICLRSHDDDNYLPIVEKRLPIVLIDQLSDHYKVDSITSDNYGAGKQAAEFLLKMGHENIGIVSGWTKFYTISERVKGFLDVIRSNGGEIKPEFILEGPMTSESGKKLFNQLNSLDNPPEAIFATNLDVGLGALVEANLQGVEVGKDLSFITIDDDELFSGMMPPITVVAQNVKKMGYEAGRLLLNKLEKDNDKMPIQTIYIETELRIRDSVSDMSKR